MAEWSGIGRYPGDEKEVQITFLRFWIIISSSILLISLLKLFGILEERGARWYQGSYQMIMGGLLLFMVIRNKNKTVLKPIGLAISLLLIGTGAYITLWPR